MPNSTHPPRLSLARRCSLSLSTFLLASSVSGQSIVWEADLDVALAYAKEQQKVLLIAVVMPGERSSDRLIEHYRDSTIGRLSRQCACFRVNVTTEPPSADALTALQRYLGAAPRDPFAVPHHLIVHPDGTTVLSSAAYQMTAGQLEWFVADGIRRFDPKFEWALSDRTRAPEGLRYGTEVEKAEQALEPPPTADEVKQAIAELKKGAGFGAAMQHYQVLLRSDEPAAIKQVETVLKGQRGGMIRPVALAVIAAASPLKWAPMLCDALDDRDAAVREDAARGLAAMAHDKSAKSIQAQLKSEQEPKVKAWLLRALAASAPKDKATIAAIDKVLADEPTAAVRMHAAVAAGAVEERAQSRRLLRRALADADALVRSAAAYAMAVSRDKEFLSALEFALQSEPDAEAKHWLTLAIDTIAKERDLQEFRNFRTKVLGERIGIDRRRGA